MLRYSAKVVAFFACAVSVFGQRQLLVDGGYEQCTNAYTSTPPGWTKTPSDSGRNTGCAAGSSYGAHSGKFLTVFGSTASTPVALSQTVTVTPGQQYTAQVYYGYSAGVTGSNRDNLGICNFRLDLDGNEFSPSDAVKTDILNTAQSLGQYYLAQSPPVTAPASGQLTFTISGFCSRYFWRFDDASVSSVGEDFPTTLARRRARRVRREAFARRTKGGLAA